MKFAAFFLCFAAVMPAQNFFSGSMPSMPMASKVTIANVEETPHEVHMRRLWVASIVAMTAATAADAASSWHKRESNSFLASADGTFGAKGVGIKAGIAGAVLVPQILLRHHQDWHLPFAASNFAEAGIFAGAVVHNVNIK